MELRDYLHFERISNAELAAKLNIARGYVNMIANGRYKPSKKLSIEIEKVTGGKVTAKGLRPDKF